MQEIKAHVRVEIGIALEFDLTHEDWDDMTRDEQYAFVKNQARYSLEANSEEIIDKSQISWG